MLWKTHIRISFEVLRQLGISLSSEVTESFKNGILAPDQWQDYPHHHGKSEKIRENLMKSRGYFLQDDLKSAFFHLGVALHYIQDSYTSMASFYPRHQSWEEDIEYANFTHDLEKTITYSLGNNWYERDRCLNLARTLSNKAQGRDNTLHVATLSGRATSKSFAKPVVDLNLGLRASYVVTESVLSSGNCSTLENKLKDGLATYEALMKNVEKDLSDKVIKLANERENLRKQRAPQSGIVTKIKNWLLGIRIGMKNSAANSNYGRYAQRKHLGKLVEEYMKTANITVAPYSGWYNFRIPEINPKAVTRELLSIQEVAEALGENALAFKESLDKVKLSSYSVGNRDVIRRAELDRFLDQFPVKGFTKSPA